MSHRLPEHLLRSLRVRLTALEDCGLNRDHAHFLLSPSTFQFTIVHSRPQLLYFRF